MRVNRQVLKILSCSEDQVARPVCGVLEDFVMELGFQVIGIVITKKLTFVSTKRNASCISPQGESFLTYGGQRVKRNKGLMVWFNKPHLFYLTMFVSMAKH